MNADFPDHAASRRGIEDSRSTIRRSPGAALGSRPGLLLASVLLLAITRGSHAQSTESFVVDFEDAGFTELMPIDSQYAGLGVTFAVENNGTALPWIVVEGAPLSAFAGPSGADTPMASGVKGLTYLGAANERLELHFDPPVESVRFFLIDIDVTDDITADAYDGPALVDTERHFAGEGSTTGDGVATEYVLSGTKISRVAIGLAGGFALDFLRFTRPCPAGATCGDLIEVAQESVPGAGDFDANVLGVVSSFALPTATAQEVYAYDVPQDESANQTLVPLLPDQTLFFLADTLDGLSIFFIHDRAAPADPDGGSAEMRCVLAGDSDGAVRTVEDDPNPIGGPPDVWVGGPGSNVFEAGCSWATTRTDGYALSDLEDAWTLEISFTDITAAALPLSGLSQWTAFSADGVALPLALQLDRRVRLRPIAVSFPGTGDDVLLTSGINATPDTIDSESADAGDFLLLGLSSPAGTLLGAPLVLFTELYLTGLPLTELIPGLWIDPAAAVILVDGLAPGPFGPSQVIVPGGSIFGMQIPSGLAGAGISAAIQGLVFGPQATNGIFALTAAHAIEVN